MGTHIKVRNTILSVRCSYGCETGLRVRSQFVRVRVQRCTSPDECSAATDSRCVVERWMHDEQPNAAAAAAEAGFTRLVSIVVSCDRTFATPAHLPPIRVRLIHRVK